MAIETERLDEIVVALTLGKEITPRNAKEKEVIERMRREINQAKKDGIQIRIPPS